MMKVWELLLTGQRQEPVVDLLEAVGGEVDGLFLFFIFFGETEKERERERKRQSE